MTTTTVEEVYEQYIKPLSVEEQIELVAITTQRLTTNLNIEKTRQKKKHSIMELRGLGKEIWQGIDAQEYVNELRREWDHRP